MQPTAVRRKARDPHTSDEGVVHLMDDRFAQTQVRALLPAWWRGGLTHKKAGHPLGTSLAKAAMAAEVNRQEATGSATASSLALPRWRKNDTVCHKMNAAIGLISVPLMGRLMNTSKLPRDNGMERRVLFQHGAKDGQHQR